MNSSNHKTSRLAAFFAVALAIAAIVFLFARDSPEAAVKQMVEDMALACRDMDLAALDARLAQDYRGEWKGTRQGLLDEADRAFGELKSLSVEIELVDAIVEGDLARAVVVFYISGEFKPGPHVVYPRFSGLRSLGGMKPEAIYMEFAADGDRWKADYIDWEVDARLDDFPKAKSELKG